MHGVNWIELWLLNQLTLLNSSVSRLIYEPRQEYGPYWAFPAKAGLRATTQQRVDALVKCVERGWVEIYLDPWLRDAHFTSRHPLGYEECHLLDPQLTEKMQAVLTLKGHDKWETEFQPDWSRYWMQIEGGEYDQQTQELTLSIVYASNEMLQALNLWLVPYWGLERDPGLVQIGCRTEFSFLATVWRVLSVAKVITWKAISANATYLRLIGALNPAGRALSEPDGAAKVALQQYMELRSEEQALAFRSLCQLSKKWRCLDQGGKNWFDADPELIAPP